MLYFQAPGFTADFHYGRWQCTVPGDGSPLHLLHAPTSLKSYPYPSTARDQSTPIVQNHEKTVNEKSGYRESRNSLPEVAPFIHSALYMVYRCGI